MLTLVHKVIHLVVLAHLQRRWRFQENELPIFYCAGCKFLWLAHWIKGEEDRGERISVSLFNSDRTLSLKRPDAEVVRPVRLSVGTVLRVKHRTLGCVRSS